ncbi:LLM class flavin-dependent oxidoreductase [Kutzneria sp. NPDC052558]|uniref:LLM class flavin-dependent oxidoreductase n=1 Tax=Kutzneria sp. NPDC052558 TaxID=3364121 RepID=UPI0037C76938
MTTFSVFLPFMPVRPENVLPFAELVRDTGLHRLWQGQSLVVEPHQAFAYAAGAGVRVPTGFGVTLAPLRHPLEAALQARSLALTTGESVVAGYGAAAVSFQQALGDRYASPITAMTEYLTLVGDLVAGRRVDVDGRYFRCHAQLPAVQTPPVEIGVGVLRPSAARLAGTVAESAITWLTPASYLRDVIVPAAHAAASDAGRKAPRIVAIVPVALASPDRDPAVLAAAGNFGHLALPHYRDMLARAGVSPTPQSLVDGRAFLYGEPESLLDGVAEFVDAGVDEIVLNVTGTAMAESPHAALAEMRRLAALIPG